jgi:large subunit ribosomal protein L17
MLRNMVTSFFDNERIETTDAKARELRKLAEKMITLGKQGNLHARRHALAVIRDRKVVKKLFEDIAPRFQERQGGYTRIFKAGHRLGDGAFVSVIELTSKASPRKKGKAGTKEKAPTPKSGAKRKERSKTPPAREGEKVRASAKKGAGKDQKNK